MLFLLWKRSGLSTFQFIKLWAREKGFQKVGHSGTLDPLAQGLVLVATDQDTKFLPYLDQGPKTYRLSLQFGYSTFSYDAESAFNYCALNLPLVSTLKTYLAHLKGEFQQIAPPFSARKINGQRAYHLARQGKMVSFNKETIKIYDCSNWDFAQYPQKAIVSFDLKVSRGTYIRSIIHQSAIALKSAAYLISLQRIELQGLSQKDLGELKLENLLNYHKITISSQDFRHLQQGKKLQLEKPEAFYKIYSEDKEFLGLVSVCQNTVTALRLTKY